MSAALGRVLLELLYPRRAVCMGCGSAAGFGREWLCDDCRTVMAKLWLGAQPLPEVPEAGAAAFCYRYAGPVKGVVRRLKYGGVRRLAEAMAADMTRACGALRPVGADLVTFVPMHPRRRRRRGYNQAELLARGLAARMDLPCEAVLRRTRNARQQARLNRRQRLENLKGGFACDGTVAGRRVLLVDDVCTTGATLRVCAQALRAKGAAAVSVVCYGRAGLTGK